MRIRRPFVFSGRIDEFSRRMPSNLPPSSPDETLPTSPHLKGETPLPPKRRLWIWFAWLAGFYGIWLTIIIAGDHWHTLKEHWPITVAMTLGSYVAGSTPMGGGTVGFPILVLLFEQPANLGRDFSFAIQSIGMVSASIFILSRRIPVAWSMLAGAMIASMIGTPIGLQWIAPHVSDLAIKLVFAVIWASFGVLHLFKAREFCSYSGISPHTARTDFLTGLIVGFLASATVSAISGVGIDMILYATLVLLFRCDLKVAIPTSVIIMAFTSLVGIGFRAATGSVLPGVYENWLAAAPIVALGAPLGVFVVNVIGRYPTLLFVSVLCLGQFAWTCRSEWENLGFGGFALACIAVGAMVAGFFGVYHWGKARGRVGVTASASEA
jgi:uncharacterized membrane protein YfcA